MVIARPVFRPMGERAVLVEVETLAAMLALHAALTASPPRGVVELVPAARTVLVVIDPRRSTPAVVSGDIARLALGREADAGAQGREVTLAITYEGEDLAETATLLGVSTEALVARHRDAAWTVAFTGFAPGFGYLVSEDWPFEVPRLESPRTRVGAGAVGLAGEFTGAYPRATPGGWRLVGTTPAPLFDPAAQSPALLTPGTHVRFQEKR